MIDNSIQKHIDALTAFARKQVQCFHHPDFTYTDKAGLIRCCACRQVVKPPSDDVEAACREAESLFVDFQKGPEGNCGGQT